MLNVSDETIYNVSKKVEIKWRHEQKKDVLSIDEFKLRKVWRKRPKNFWTETVGFSSKGTTFTHKKSPFALHKKWSFPLRISLVDVNKSAGNYGFNHIC